MHRYLNFALAALLALSAGVAAADARPNPGRGGAGQKQNSQDPPERRRHATRIPPGETEQEPDRVPALFRELSPHRAGRLEKMRTEDPERFRGILRHMARKMRELDRLRRKDAEEFNRQTSILRLEDLAARISDQLRTSADLEVKIRVKRELQAALEELFDKKEEAQRARLRRMEKDLQELKERLDDRRRKRKEMIEKRLEELTGAESTEF